MDCRTFHRKLEDYLEGGLDFAGRFGMERHASQCFACGKFAADAQKFGRAARQLTVIKAPADFETALMVRIQREGIRRKQSVFWRLRTFFLDWPGLRPVAWSGATIALLAVAAIVAFRVNWGDTSAGAVSARRQPALLERGSTPNPPISAMADSGAMVGMVPVHIRGNALAPVLTSSDEPAAVFAEREGFDFIESLVPGPNDQPIRMRLPRAIRMHYVQPSEDYYIRNVSH